MKKRKTGQRWLKRSPTVLKMLFAIWKSTWSSIIKHNKIFLEIIGLTRLRIAGVLEIYASNLVRFTLLHSQTVLSRLLASEIHSMSKLTLVLVFQKRRGKIHCMPVSFPLSFYTVFFFAKSFQLITKKIFSLLK